MELHIRHCCSVLGACGIATRRILEKIQNRSIRITTDSPYDESAKSLIKQQRLPDIPEMIRQELANMVCKAMNSQAASYLSSRFNSMSAATNRTLKSPRILTKFRQNSFAYRGGGDYDLQLTTKGL